MSKPKILPENRDRVIKSACALCNEVFKENFGSAVCGADGSTTITAPISVSYVTGRGVTAHIRMADRRAEDTAPVLTRYRVGVVADDSDWTAVEEAAMQSGSEWDGFILVQYDADFTPVAVYLFNKATVRVACTLSAGKYHVSSEPYTQLGAGLKIV